MKEMTKKVTKVAVFIGLAFTASGASATDWNVIQDANITVAAPSITQGAANNVVNSNQAVNGIVLDTANDSLATGSQTADIASSTGIVLTQGGSVDGSNQAINLIEADDVGSTSAITQTVNQTATSLTTLTQIDGSSVGGNVQAANLTKAVGDIDRLVQDYDESGRMDLIQSSVSTASNVQGVNYATGASVGTVSLVQSVEVDGRARLIQGAGNTGGNNVQVGNGAVATAASGDVNNATQTFTATAATLRLRQRAAGDNNIQAVNMMRTTGATGNIGDTVGTTSQTVTVASGAANFTQDVSGTGNVQAGNLAMSANNISDLTQTFTAGGATQVDFDQTPTAASNTQAGNMAVLTNGAANDQVDEISQVFTSSTSITAFDQVSASGTLIQAGNLIDVTTGDINDSGTTQQFDALGGAVSMVQSGAGVASGNLQALNAIVDETGNGSGGTVSQVLTITSATFAMSQDNITGSGQYGNFVGVKY